MRVRIQLSARIPGCRRSTFSSSALPPDGALLEIGVLDIDGDDPVVIHAMRLRQKFFELLDSGGEHHRHSDADIERANQRFEQLADELDPKKAHVERTDDLREIAAASEAMRADEARRRVVVLVRPHSGTVTAGTIDARSQHSTESMLPDRLPTRLGD